MNFLEGSSCFWTREAAGSLNGPCELHHIALQTCHVGVGVSRRDKQRGEAQTLSYQP